MTDNLITFKPHEKTRHDKFQDMLKTQEFACFWMNENGGLSYCLGKELTIEQQVMIEKVLSIVNVDTMKEQMHFD